MIVHRPHPQCIAQTVETFGRSALEHPVLFPVATHAVDHIESGPVTLRHLVNSLDIVLKVGIYAYCRVATDRHGLETCHKRELVAGVGRKLQTSGANRFRCKPFYYVPGAVSGAVIDIKDEASV